MKKWYLMLLLATGVGGWFAYPHIYPKITAFISDGTLPWKTGDDAAVAKPAAEDGPVDALETAGTAPSSPMPASRRQPKVDAPSFAPIDEVVGNWKAIPDSAFPKKTKLLKPVTYKITGGTGSLAAGSDVVALSASGGILTVAPNENSTLQAQVAIDDTDFKSVLTAVYEKFKKRKLDQFEAAQADAAALAADEDLTPVDIGPAIVDKIPDPMPGQATGANTRLPPKPANIDAKTRAILGEAPLQFVDGTVPAMIRSMEAGQVKEIRADMIRYWGRIHYEDIDGQPYWVGRVDYTANTIFGIFPTQAKALMRKNKVIKWIYAGTGEPVP